MNLDTRQIKQLIYGGVFLLIVVSLLAGAYWVWLKPAPSCIDNTQNGNETGIDCGGSCESCEIRTLTPPTVNWTRFFNADGQTIVVAEIKNSNESYGSPLLSYTFNVYNRGDEKVTSLSGTSFLYSLETKYLFGLVPLNLATVGRVDTLLEVLRWTSAQELPKPSLEVRGVKTSTSTAGVIVTGTLDNQNATSLSILQAIALLFNQNNDLISASKTDLSPLRGFDSTPFTILFPKNIVFPSSSPTPAFSYVFSRDLSVGSDGDDVRELQRFLASQGFFKAATSQTFGAVTKQALLQFQKKFNINPATGYFGPKTRDYINSITQPQPQPAFDPNVIDPSKTKVYVDGIR